MRQDYLRYFNILRALLSESGAVCVAESELSAKFALPSGWVLEFECEKYYGPSWNLKIRSSDRGVGYDLWILMEAFQSLTGKSYGLPTMENQVGFMIAEADRIFKDVEFYSVKYDELNSAV